MAGSGGQALPFPTPTDSPGVELSELPLRHPKTGLFLHRVGLTDSSVPDVAGIMPVPPVDRMSGRRGRPEESYRPHKRAYAVNINDWKPVNQHEAGVSDRQPLGVSVK